jgi:ricin-type beta-trefoil lectin protein
MIKQRRQLAVALSGSLCLAGCAGDLAGPSAEVSAGLSAPSPDILVNTLQLRGLRSAGDVPLCLDINGANPQLGTDLILYNCHGGANQQFTYDRSSGTVQSAMGSWCVDVSGSVAAAGTKVQIWGCNGTGAQTWTYDSPSGNLRFSPAPSLCLDLSSGAAQLANCGNVPAQTFNLHGRYGDRRFDELSWLTTHNSFNNNEDASWLVPNQGHSIARQLNDGVRGLMLDVWSFKSSTARCITSFGKDCYPQDLYMCHSDCNGVPGIGYALPRQTVASGLVQVVSFLQGHPGEIVTVFLEDYANHDDLQRLLDSVRGLRDLQFDPYAWDVTNRGWPHADDLLNSNKRLLLISDHGDKRDLGVGYGPDLTVENYWSIGETANNLSCYSRWDSIPLDRTDNGFQRLFVMNHFRDIPMAALAAQDNSYNGLTSRILGQCVPAAKRKPNFIGVDFYDTADGFRVTREVDSAAVILFGDANYGGAVQLLPPGNWDVSDLTIGNDQLSSLKVAPSTQVVLHYDGAFLGPVKAFQGDASYVGDDFNDQASSINITRTGR